MNFKKALGLYQNVDGLADQLRDAKLAPPKDSVTFTHACGEMLFFEHPIANEAERSQALSQYISFARELSAKVVHQAQAAVSDVYVSKNTTDLMAGFVEYGVGNILKGGGPYEGVFARRSAVLMRLFFGIKPRDGKAPILMIDVRTEEWKEHHRKGKDPEFLPNGLIEVVSQRKG